MYAKQGFAKTIVIAGGLGVTGLLGAPSALADTPVCPVGSNPAAGARIPGLGR